MSEAHYLSEGEVNEACELASKGQQRLREVSETKATFFHFVASCQEHFGSVAVRVSPVIHGESRYPSYDVFAFYQPCCDAAQTREADEQIKLLLQLVYDTCIQAIRRRFDDGWYGARFPSLSS